METANVPKAFSEKIAYGTYLKYNTPSILSMVAISFYSAIDGFFVSHYVNSDALASINIVIPYVCLIYAIAMMLATGAGAYIAMSMGDKKLRQASEQFSFISLSLLAMGGLLTLFSFLFLDKLLALLGTTQQLMPYARTYGICSIASVIPMMFKLFLEQLVRVDGNPGLSFRMSLYGLIANIILDALLTIPIPLGILGAGLGTLLSILVSTLMGVWYFLPKTPSNLKFRRPRGSLRFLLRSCVNGTSQLMVELSTGVVTLLFNLAILRYEGENGVAAASIIMFLYYFFISIYMGIACGTAPAISYSRGARLREVEKSLLRQTNLTLLWLSPAITILSYLGSKWLVAFYTSDSAIAAITVPANRLFSWCYLCAGINIFASAYYTAVDKGILAGFLSFMRCLVFSVAAIEIMAHFFQANGVWLALPTAEAACTVLVAAILIVNAKRQPTSKQA